MIGTFLTDRGKVRSHNEDAGGLFYNQSKQFLAAIADGMGGHQAGDVASQMAISLIREKWENTNKFTTPDEIEKWLTESIKDINESIYLHAKQNKECEGMGTTIVITIHIHDFLTIAHIGDSRCYMLNEDGFKQITEDHSLVNALVQSGQITKDDALYHPRKNVVLRALGSENNVEVDIRTINVEIGDKILLCTDGVTDKILDNELYEVIHLENDLTEIGQQLIDMANERGGEDNISLIILSKGSTLKAGDDK